MTTPEQIEKEVREIDPDAVRKCDDLVLLNPTRADKSRRSFRINVNTEAWADFATGDKGKGLKSFLAYCKKPALSAPEPKPASKSALEAAWPAAPMGDKGPPLPTTKARSKLTTEWLYPNAAGRLIYAVARYDGPEGKTFRPWHYVDNEWQVGDPPGLPLPLYGLDRLAARPDAPVLVVEGEKAADAAQKLFPNYTCVTSPHGSNSAGKAFWGTLAGRSVTIWRDNDEPGRKYEADVKMALQGVASTVRVVQVPENFPVKWDLADSVPDGADLQALLGGAVEVRTATRLTQISWSSMRGRPVLPVQFDIQGLFPRVEFGIIAGQPGHGKSILVVQASVAKATGLPLLGFDASEPGGVVAVVLEDDFAVVHRRVQAAVVSYGEQFTEEHHRLLDINLRILMRPTGELSGLSPDQLNLVLSGLTGEIEEAMRSCESPPAMIFIDTLNSVHDGDENNAKETRPLVAAVLGLSARTGCSTWLVHHLVKVRGERLPLVERMDPELLRGSSAIHGAVRGAVQFGWIVPSEAKKVGLDPERCNRRFAVLGVTKQNDGVPGPWMLIQHSADAGLWERVPNGEVILTGIQSPKGSNGPTGLKPAESVLVALSQVSKIGKFDRAALAVRLWPNGKDATGSLRKVIEKLRKNKLVQLDKDELTPQGRKEVESILVREGEVGP